MYKITAMIHESPAPLKSEVQWACAVLRCSQNTFARSAGVDPSILSRVINGLVTSGPADKRIRRYVAKMRRRMVTRERTTA